MYVAEALTPLVRLGTFSWIVTRDSYQKNSQFPTLVAAHQAEVRGPPVGRGPQVENRWSMGRTPQEVCLLGVKAQPVGTHPFGDSLDTKLHSMPLLYNCRWRPPRVKLRVIGTEVG